MFKEFKEFAMRGNVMDMAVGVIIGGAFGTIVSSFVSDIMMPVLGVLAGDIDYSNYFVVIAGPQGPFATLKAAQEAGAVTINYGVFISAVLHFFIIMLALFFFVKAINSMKRKEEDVAPATEKCRFCFMEIPVEASKCPYCTADLK